MYVCLSVQNKSSPLPKCYVRIFFCRQNILQLYFRHPLSRSIRKWHNYLHLRCSPQDQISNSAKLHLVLFKAIQSMKIIISQMQLGSVLLPLIVSSSHRVLHKLEFISDTTYYCDRDSSRQPSSISPSHKSFRKVRHKRG